MYTLLLRIGLMHQRGTSWRKTIEDILDERINPYQIYDKKQLADAMPGINHIMQHGDRKLFGGNIKNNYPAKIPIGEMHNRFGIVGFSEGSPKYEMPNWYKMGDPNQQKPTAIKVHSVKTNTNNDLFANDAQLKAFEKALCSMK